MVLTRLQCRRFFNLFDALTVFANKRLEVVDEAELFTDGVRGIDDQAQARVAHELWQNLNVIDDYIVENPDGFSAGELSVIASWRRGLTDTFIVDFFPDGELRFISAGYAFEVTGLSKHIDTMLPELPAAVQTTLLPFDGRIVYAEYLGDHLIDFGDGMLSLFEEEVERIYDEGRIVSSPDELLSIADDLREWRLARDTQEMLADLDAGAFDARGQAADHIHDDGYGCGHDHHHAGSEYDEYDELEEDIDPADYEQHVGVLAGLSFEDREQAIETHMREEEDSLMDRLVEILDDECVDGPMARGLAELLQKDHPHDVRRLAKNMGLERARELEGDELIADIVAHVADEDALQDIVNDFHEYQIMALKRLVDSDGRIEIAEGDIVGLRDLPRYEPGMSYVFHEDGTFMFVMPDEVLTVMRCLDWDAALGAARRFRKLVDVLDKVTELRGIVALDQAVAEYWRCCGDERGLTENRENITEITGWIIQGIMDQVANYDLLQTPDGGHYLLHYELMWVYEEQMGIERNPDFITPSIKGELGEMLEGLLAQQKGKEPRPLTPEMLEAQSLYDWKIRQPAAWTMLQYFDAHVPALREDHYFADKVMEELIDDAKWGLMDQGVQRLFDVLDANDFMPDKDQIQEILDLWSNLCNGLPVWPNNGWSPNELASVDLGHPVFLDETGAPRKIGRNDPCPCGSGLKYKKCCGK